jgi:pilus assembly protein FimV
MSRGQKPLLLMMALSMPGTGHAMGLGDIHVNSKLNEPLAAEIDIVGATADELMGLRASLANRETFQRFGFERPAFLSSTTFKVTQNGQGHPVLMLRSSDSFTDPLVSILVDLDWGNGELVREYTLLLDPAGFGTNRAGTQSASPVAEAAPAAAAATSATTVTPAAATVARDADGAPSTAGKVSRYKIGAKATLRGIAWRTGARSKSDLNRLMIAIFRANPSAFEGNINRLRKGAFVDIPGPAVVSAIPRTEANREISTQMAAWHAAGKSVATRALAAAAVPAIALPAVAQSSVVPADNAPPAVPAPAAASAVLNLRVQSLEQSLDTLQRELKSQNESMRAVQQQVRRTEEPAPVAEVAPEPAPSRSSVLSAVIAGVLTLCGAIGAGYFVMLRRATRKSKESLMARAHAAGERAAEDPAAVDLPLEFYPQSSFPQSSVPQSSVPAGDSSPTAEMPAISTAMAEADGGAVVVDDTRPLPVLTNPNTAATVALPTVVLPAIVAASDATVRLPSTGVMSEHEVLDLFSDTHVHMPSALNEQPQMKERRTNLVDVLRKAIERDPDRHDLRLKLLELYFGQAATNRQGFMDVVQKFAQERKVLPDGEWEKIASMGRQIVPDSPLFSDAVDDEQLADCA